MNEPQTLQTLVKRALGDGTSGRQLAVRAEQAGHKVAFTTINAIAAGTYKSKPSAETIRAIAYLAGVSDEAAFTAAGYPLPGPPFADELPPGVDQLSARSRRAAVEILRALVEAETSQDGEGRAERPAPNTGAGETPALTKDDVDLAAYEKTGPTRLEQLRAAQDADAEGSQD